MGVQLKLNNGQVVEATAEDLAFLESDRQWAQRNAAGFETAQALLEPDRAFVAMSAATHQEQARLRQKLQWFERRGVAQIIHSA